MRILRDDGTELSASTVRYFLAMMSVPAVARALDRILADPDALSFLITEAVLEPSTEDIAAREFYCLHDEDGDAIILWEGVGAMQLVNEPDKYLFVCTAIGGEGEDARQAALTTLARTVAENNGVDIVGTGGRGSA